MSIARGSQLVFPVAVWAVWRLGHGVVLLTMGGDLIDDAFRFDGGWFLDLLEHGYQLSDPSFETQQNVAFFPGVVWLAEPFSWVLGNRAAAILVANLTSLGGFVAVFGATSRVRNPSIARWSVIGLAVWPASVVMTAFYSEGLFLSATATAIWAAERDRHAVGTAASFVAATTRSIGFVLGPVMAVARSVRIRQVDGKTVAYALSGPVGLALVAATQGVQVDDPLAFAKAQEGWDRSLSAPWVPIYRAADGIVEKLPTPAMELSFNLAALLLVGAALVVVTVRIWRGPSAWGFLGWGWTAWLAPLLTTLPSSQVRFALAAWPAFSAWGEAHARWVRCVRGAALAASIVVSVFLVRRWANGEFIA